MTLYRIGQIKTKTDYSDTLTLPTRERRTRRARQQHTRAAFSHRGWQSWNSYAFGGARRACRLVETFPDIPHTQRLGATRRMIQNRNVLIDELKQIIVSEVSRINQVYRRGPSLYFYHRTIELRRMHPAISQFLSSDYCIEIIYATLVSWDMNSRRAKMKDFEEFRDNLRANLTAFEKLESLSVDFSYNNPCSVLECMSAIYDSLDLMQTGGRLVSSSKCLHFLFPKVCLPVDHKNTLAKIYRNTNESKNKFMEILELSFDTLAQIPDRSWYLDQEWNVFETKLVDNAIILLKSTQPVVAPDDH